jgi:hypothetical protein
MRLGRFMTLLYWLILIGVSFGVFYYFQPYLDSVLKLYNQAKTQFENVNSGISGFQQRIGQ